MGSTYVNGIDTNKIVEAILKALEGQTLQGIAQKKVGFDENFSLQSLADAMVKNAPDIGASSNIKEKAQEIEHKSTNKETEAVIKTIKEHV